MSESTEVRDSMTEPEGRVALWLVFLRAAAFVATGSLLLAVSLILGSSGCEYSGVSISAEPALPVLVPLLFAYLVGRSGYLPANRDPEYWLHFAGMNSALWLVVFYVLVPRLGEVTGDATAFVSIGVAAVLFTFLGAFWGRRRAT